ncbi:oligoribonuclease [Macrolepiota fuliginosa MF-IS2]|uniref:Oligoribonuclease n=1 Tax=Macrolepiota fuliginosa MF-IS2 TaxID=1400762 RepID=A0A9P5XKS0_9AGAR|nr:oligoribonuclease [Macrolepiota fuliginosa MF-IS2]
MSKKPLDFYVGPLVWIDCEMTGLNPRKDKILEIAVLITNGNLEVVDDGIQFIIKTEKETLDQMDEWCTNQHGQSGLTQSCIDSPYTREVVASEVLKYIKQWIPQPRTGVLAGSSVHADRAFLAEEMPEIVDWLHYRWFPRNMYQSSGETAHRALEDIRGSIRELQWYRENLFISPEQANKLNA